MFDPNQPGYPGNYHNPRPPHRNENYDGNGDEGGGADTGGGGIILSLLFVMLALSFGASFVHDHFSWKWIAGLIALLIFKISGQGIRSLLVIAAIYYFFSWKGLLVFFGLGIFALVGPVVQTICCIAVAIWFLSSFFI